MIKHTRSYEPSAGESISVACERAIALAKEHNEIVRFVFNGILMRATVRSVHSELAASYSRQCERQAKKWRCSPEGKASAKQRAKEVVRKQNDASRLSSLLRDVLSLNDLDAAIGWLVQFQEVADDVDVKINHLLIAAEFEQAGYKENEHVGEQPEWFTTRQRMGRYIIGQAIIYLYKRMPPHPITVDFARKYFELL